MTEVRLLPVARVAVPTAVGVPALLDQANEQNHPGAWALCGVAVLLSVAASLGRDLAPLRSFAAVLAIGIATQLASAAGGVRVSTLVVLPLGYAFYFLGRFAQRRPSAVAAVVSILLMLGALALNQLTAAPDRTGGLEVVAVVAALPLGWALGILVGARDEELHQAQREQEHRAALEQHRLHEARVEDRLAIARDMHDVVAHSLTALTVHAEVLRSRSGELPGWANDRLDALAEAARRANHELHGVLGTLRRQAAGPVGSAVAVDLPPPAVADLGRLVGGAQRAGQHIDFEIGDTSGLSRLQEATLYRVVQEAVSNARRHAPGALTRIRVHRDEDTLLLDVTNDRSQTNCVPTTRATGGLGLLGMRERVQGLGGSLTHGPTPAGGFHVSARIPLDPTAQVTETRR